MNTYSDIELKELGFRQFGKNVKISKKASIYGTENITIGNNVRIDDFCILSAGLDGITLRNNIHIAAYASLIGQAHVAIDDFANISARVSIS